ncbi:hypothetical protein [Roseovarius phycicola]|uniref:Uncharacterized protein n=1 Tax=Roseovarius phycicola TaxID=3080976 RepID=A0ABZ2HIP1_9RHOB
MIIEALAFDTIRYNPEIEGFEASVRIRDAVWMYNYPVHIKAPLTADYALVARGLMQRAREQHKASKKPLFSQLLRAANGPALAA